MESATENIPLVLFRRKPHPEQDQIGELTCGPHGSRVGRLRPAVTQCPDEWLSTTKPGLSAGSRLIICS